jgi:hypothetical protein
MCKKTLAALLGAASAAVGAYAAQAGTSAGGGVCAKYHPGVPAPSRFAKTIDNPYFPLPVGRTLVYRGVENGKKESTGCGLPGGRRSSPGSPRRS